MNKDAGRGDWLIVMVRLESDEKLPFVVDTGCPITTFDKSLEAKLGKRLGAVTVWNFGVGIKTEIYAAPKLYVRNALLMMTGTNVGACDCKQLCPTEGRPIMGILGMDVLEHYCIQLDFNRGKMRFLDDERAKKTDWGQPFPLTDIGDGCFSVAGNLAHAKGPSSLIDTGCNYGGWLVKRLFQQWTNQAISLAHGETRAPDGVLGEETYHDLELHGLDERLNANDSRLKLNGIGLRVLAQNLVTLDFPRRTMYLKRASDWPLAPKHIQSEAKSWASSAADFLKRLKQKGRLPGWSKNDGGGTTAFHFQHDAHLDSVTLDAQKMGDSSIYHYTVTRASKGRRWQLQKAWRTGQDGQIMEEYPVP
ncbi:MAG TPA: hypothetical protein VG146_07960 [Verrucomicrobiae bacterium]|nr:hypothetical protein [Verrucomicrobiae bacterium]